MRKVNRHATMYSTQAHTTQTVEEELTLAFVRINIRTILIFVLILGILVVAAAAAAAAAACYSDMALCGYSACHGSRLVVCVSL